MKTFSPGCLIINADDFGLTLASLSEKCVLAVVIRKGELMIPDHDTMLQPADEVRAVVSTNRVKDLADLLG